MVSEEKHSTAIIEVRRSPVFSPENTVPRKSIRGLSVTLVEDGSDFPSTMVNVILVPLPSSDSMEH